MRLVKPEQHNIDTSGQHSVLEQITTYQIKGKTFIVEPVFKADGKDTIGSILMRLMQSDRDNT